MRIAAGVVLDEPAGGLDPAGIRWMRDLFRDYADHGATVLLSSRLLAGIEIITDDIVMIGQGRIVCQGSTSELPQAAGSLVRSPDIHAEQRALIGPRSGSRRYQPNHGGAGVTRE